MLTLLLRVLAAEDEGEGEGRPSGALKLLGELGRAADSSVGPPYPLLVDADLSLHSALPPLKLQPTEFNLLWA